MRQYFGAIAAAGALLGGLMGMPATAADAPPTAADMGLMVGAPPPADKQVTLANWQYGPYNRWAFQHVRQIIPTVPVSRGSGPVRDFEGAPQDLNGLSFTYGNGKAASAANIGQMIADTYTDGILVLHRGEIVSEQYFNGLTPDRPHLLWSVGKSFFGMLAGIIAAEDAVDIAAPVSRYVPELAMSGWGDNTIRQVLDMQSTSAWVEDYADAQSSVRRQDASNGLLPLPTEFADLPRGNYNFLPTIGRDDTRAGVFIYKSGDTDVVAWVLERATNMRAADLLSDRLFARLGAEHDAYITVDPSGSVLASGGLNVTLRDLARFGQMVLDGGRVGAKQVAPARWIADMQEKADPGPWQRGPNGEGQDGAYRTFFWHTLNDHGAFYARGVHGQYVYIDPVADVVIVKLSSNPDPSAGFHGISMAGFDAIARHLMGD